MKKIMSILCMKYWNKETDLLCDSKIGVIYIFVPIWV